MQSPRVIVVALLLVTVTLSNFQVASTRGLLDDVPTDYLPLGDAAKFVPPLYSGKTVLEIIKHNPMPYSPSEMTARMKEILETAEDPDTGNRELYFKELLNLSGPRAECTSQMRRFVVTTLALGLANQGEPAVENYVNYVKLFGGLKFGSCAQETGAEFERAQVELAHNTEEALDELFMAYIDAPKIVEYLELYQEAKKMNFVSDTYKVRRMLKVARQFMPQHDEKLNSRDHLKLFIQTYCGRMQEPLVDVFATFNLARALGVQMTTPVSIRFLKLNEYNRLCLAWQDQRLEAAVANLERQLKATKWYKLNGKLSQPSCLGSNCLGD